jgi:hypothetical protein
LYTQRKAHHQGGEIMHANGSEVARLRQQIADEYTSAQRGLSGLACGTARHQFIAAKMEKMGQCHEELVTLLGLEEAIALMVETLEGV